MQMYQNPIILPEQDAEYGLGDPFVFRFNGHYYLYPSGNRNSHSIVAWESEDMLSWRFIGSVANDDCLNWTYAPEVLYYNGIFYLVGSPKGEGHYFYTSDSPKGPFVRQTDNVGLAIDGSLFADDDASLYFTHAEYPAIHGHRINLDFSMCESHELCGTSMGHWTEGPGIFKRKGKYYITMTGNHLMSRGYRVDYAVSEVGPLGPYFIPRNKTILVNTDYEHGSLGHSSTVIGPDLDSYWIFYHSYPVDRQGQRHGRFIHMDRLLFAGDVLSVNGPTLMPCRAPSLPDFSGWADKKGKRSLFIRKKWGVLTRVEMGKQGTAEICLIPGDQGMALFGWRDDGHNFEVSFAEKTLTIYQNDNGQMNILLQKPLFKNFQPDVLHTVRMECEPDGLSILIDHMQQGKVAGRFDCSGRIGVKYAVFASYIAFHNQVSQSSDRLIEHAVPGQINCVHNLPDDADRHLLSVKERQGLLMHKGESISYAINVAEGGLYHIQANLQVLSDAKMTCLFDDGAVTQQTQCMATIMRIELGKSKLQSGMQKWSFSVDEGEILLLDFDIFPVLPKESGAYKGLELCYAADLMEGDSCIRRMEGLQMDRPGQVLARFGRRFHTNGYIETDMIFRGDNLEKSAGLFLRISENSTYPDQVEIGHRGYYIGFDTHDVFIWRMNFNKIELLRQRCRLKPEISYRIRAEMRNNMITVDLDNKNIASISEDDPLPFGLAGVGSFSARVTFTRVKYELE